MDSLEEKSDYESLREKNVLEMRKLLGFDYNPDAVSSNKNIDFEVSIPKRVNTGAQYRKNKTDESFKPRIRYIPEERRQSLRIAKMEPLDCYKELELEDELLDKNIDDDLEGYVKSLQKIVRPRRRSSRSENLPVVDGLRVKIFTQEEIDNIAKLSRDKKKLDGIGSTCHQCRQHSSDTKSFCHNARCTNINGQLCGPCLHGRYGEDLETVLKDPKWICPYCRGICNCSFCRRRTGRLPTGILAHIASQQGYKSVHHLLNLSRNDDESDNDKENQNDVVAAHSIEYNDDTDLDITSQLEIQQKMEKQESEQDEVFYRKENCILDYLKFINDNEDSVSSKNFVKTGEVLLGFDEDLKPVTRILA